MAVMTFPVIDPIETGRNIVRLRQARGLSVRDVQRWFNFDEPRAIYKWQSGKTLPSVDNLFALSALLEVSMNEILVAAGSRASCAGSQVHAFDPVVFWGKGSLRGHRAFAGSFLSMINGMRLCAPPHTP